MNRSDRRASLRAGKSAQSKPWNVFEDITVSAKYTTSVNFDESSFDRVWQNNRYIVFLMRNNRVFKGATFDRVMVRRSDSQPICSWADLQRIKNELFGSETEAIQFLPKQSELVDQANLYWFFVEST